MERFLLFLYGLSLHVFRITDGRIGAAVKWMTMLCLSSIVISAPHTLRIRFLLLPMALRGQTRTQR